MSELPEKKLAREVPHLPNDLIFKILLLLPAKHLYRLSFVCKTWHSLINSSNFVEAHIRQCEKVLVFLQPISHSRPNTFSIEARLHQFSLFQPSSDQNWRAYINFLELQDTKGKTSDPNISGFGDILATCNGLILATNQKDEALLVMNPTTRKLAGLRRGTIVASRDESYGFVFMGHTSEYKVVHLFRDALGHVGCEILSLTTRTWHAVDGPSFGLFSDFKHRAVTASDVLYWLPGKKNVSDLVFMNMNDEKLIRRGLPVTSNENDRLVEIGGFVSFVAHVTLYRMQLWILKRNEHGDDWVKQYTINMDYDTSSLVPVFTIRNGREIVFKKNTDILHCYDFEDEEMKEVELEKECISYGYSFLPHSNTLASWEKLRSL